MPPQVTLTSPIHGSAIYLGGTFALAATATDDGTIAKVELLADGAVISVVQQSPYQHTWTAPPAGRHRLEARATDDAGLVATSNVVEAFVLDLATVTATSPALWWRADAGVTTTGGRVWTWADQSPAGRHATQPADVYQPALPPGWSTVFLPWFSMESRTT